MPCLLLRQHDMMGAYPAEDPRMLLGHRSGPDLADGELYQQ
ncbi:hypothetical protein [Streptosporangium soli]